MTLCHLFLWHYIKNLLKGTWVIDRIITVVRSKTLLPSTTPTYSKHSVSFMQFSGPFASLRPSHQRVHRQLTARKRWRSGCHSTVRAPRVLPRRRHVLRSAVEDSFFLRWSTTNPAGNQICTNTNNQDDFQNKTSNSQSALSGCQLSAPCQIYMKIPAAEIDVSLIGNTAADRDKFSPPIYF
jgi:hypothetical protein